jgi:hypothetical protein
MSEMQIFKKTEGWESRLDQLVAEATGKTFAWGDHDCALFAAAAVQAQIEVDFAADIRGRYDSLESGLKLLQRLGYLDHVALAAAKLPETPVSLAQVGDVAVVDLGTAGVTLTIVGGYRLHGPMLGMRGTMPLTSASRAFAVGRKPEL